MPARTTRLAFVRCADVQGLHLGNLGLFGGQLGLARFGGNATSFAFNLKTGGREAALALEIFAFISVPELRFQESFVAIAIEFACVASDSSCASNAFSFRS